jgi:DNA-binding response OmpR family regulator
VLDVAISRLRDKLGDKVVRIETVRGVGYRLEASR